MAYFVYAEPGQRSMAENLEFFVRRGGEATAYFVYAEPSQRSITEKFYQEALRTPGISPL